MSDLSSYLPQDRVRALANGASLPGRTRGTVLFADISGFTAVTEALRNTLGARRGAEELTSPSRCGLYRLDRRSGRLRRQRHRLLRRCDHLLVRRCR